MQALEYIILQEIIIHNIKNEYKCLLCDGIYSTASNLARHNKACSKRNNLLTQYLTKIEKMELEINHFKEVNEMIRN